MLFPLARAFLVACSFIDQEGFALINIRNLTKTFEVSGQTITALERVNIVVDQGDIFGIIGMSGAGKSTLLRCIGLLEKPTSGEIYLDGVNTSHVSGKELIALRKEIGIIFQGYHLLMQKNVRRNIAFPLEIAKIPRLQIQRRVDELLELTGLTDKENAYPAQLSGGQKQRVAIARALAVGSKVLLCDEPTSALDPLTTRSILQLLRKINKTLGVTIVIITHDTTVVRSICNKVAVIDSSTVIEQGFVKDVFTRPEHAVTEQFLSLELGGEWDE